VIRQLNMIHSLPAIDSCWLNNQQQYPKLLQFRKLFVAVEKAGVHIEIKAGIESESDRSSHASNNSDIPISSSELTLSHSGFQFG